MDTFCHSALLHTKAASIFKSCIAAHPQGNWLFVNATIPSYLTPFIENPRKEMPHEYLRLTSLGVIGQLVKVDDAQIIRSLQLRSSLFFHTLHGYWLYNIVKSSEYFDLILLNEEALSYYSAPVRRFPVIASRLGCMIEQLAEEGRLAEDVSKQLLKLIILCYHRLSENPRACVELRNWLPRRLRDSSFTDVLKDDVPIMQCLQKLLHDVDYPSLTRTLRRPEWDTTWEEYYRKLQAYVAKERKKMGI